MIYNSGNNVDEFLEVGSADEKEKQRVMIGWGVWYGKIAGKEGGPSQDDMDGEEYLAGLYKHHAI